MLTFISVVGNPTDDTERYHNLGYLKLSFMRQE